MGECRGSGSGRISAFTGIEDAPSLDVANWAGDVGVGLDSGD